MKKVNMKIITEITENKGWPTILTGDNSKREVTKFLRNPESLNAIMKKDDFLES